MNYIYDIVLNFFDVTDSYDFYEWMESDSIVLIQKIPIVRILPEQLDDISNFIIQVDSSFLNYIYNMTSTERGNIPYSILMTDLNRVIGLKFTDDGRVKEVSHLLLDEEDFIMEEANSYEIFSLSYIKLDSIINVSFLTRREKKMRSRLLRELKWLYDHHVYDEIHYLYTEIFSEIRDKDEEFIFLRDFIDKHFDSSCKRLYDIVNLTKKEAISN